jgi:hypothetical protein
MPRYPVYDPWALLGVVLNDLAVHNVKREFGDLPEAVQHTADLLASLGVEPVIPEDDDGAPPDPGCKPPSEPPGEDGSPAAGAP